MFPDAKNAGRYRREGWSVAAERWLREVFHESPTGIDFRLMRSAAFFTPGMIALADSLREHNWRRIQQASAAAAVVAPARYRFALRAVPARCML